MSSPAGRGTGCRTVVSVISSSLVVPSGSATCFRATARERTLLRIWSRLSRPQAEEHAAPIRAVTDNRALFVRQPLASCAKRNHREALGNAGSGSEDAEDAGAVAPGAQYFDPRKTL